MTNDIQNDIKLKIQALLAIDNLLLQENDALVTSGLLNSLNIVALATWLEEKYSLDFSTRRFNIYDFETIASIARLCSQGK